MAAVTEARREYQREWQREYERNKKATDPEWVERRRDYQRNYQLLAKFGMTEADYQVMLDAQGGVCALCGAEPQDRALAVDHDRSCCPGQKSCGKCIRALLCSGCNTGLGNLQDDPELLRKAADYVEAY